MKSTLYVKVASSVEMGKLSLQVYTTILRHQWMPKENNLELFTKGRRLYMIKTSYDIKNCFQLSNLYNEREEIGKIPVAVWYMWDMEIKCPWIVIREPTVYASLTRKKCYTALNYYNDSYLLKHFPEVFMFLLNYETIETCFIFPTGSNQFLFQKEGK